MNLLRFLFLLSLKVLARLFYRFEVESVGPSRRVPYAEAKIGILLNHTSLLEPVFLGFMPLNWIWMVASRGVLPGADSTLDRPIVGKLFKIAVPQVVGVTRSRDHTWRDFMSRIRPHSVVLMAPEGRMKRRNGLDKHGKAMSVRGGIVDVLERTEGGTMLILYSGGLHHVQAPGELPRLFRAVQARVEEVEVDEYKRERGFGTPGFRSNVMSDLERRRDLHCRWS